MNTKLVVHFWVVQIFFISPILHQAQQQDHFIYNGFKGTNISLNGVAMVDKNGFLSLTRSETLNSIGHGFYPYPIQFKNYTTRKVFSFSTKFSFSIIPEYPNFGGDGLAFTIASTKEIYFAYPGPYLGLSDPVNEGNFFSHVFAVEFDIFQNQQFSDQNDNHIGININRMKSKASVAAEYFDGEMGKKKKLDLKSGKVIYAWVEYDSLKRVVSVWVSPSDLKPSRAILSCVVDLGYVFKGHMFVGFSAATGQLSSSHNIHQWSFNMNG